MIAKCIRVDRADDWALIFFPGHPGVLAKGEKKNQFIVGRFYETDTGEEIRTEDSRLAQSVQAGTESGGSPSLAIPIAPTSPTHETLPPPSGSPDDAPDTEESQSDLDSDSTSPSPTSDRLRDEPEKHVSHKRKHSKGGI
jgi:hypothetical protein